MNAVLWKHAQELFHKAVSLAGDEREQYVSDACEGDAELKDLLAGLLESDLALSDAWEKELASLVKEALPADLGPYRFVRFLGQGGMGTVFQAEHLVTGQLVAIKVLRVTELSAASRERFATEQRALAQMNHPLIARLYASEKFPDGTPCFVMEYVEGQPLTTYCEEHKCSVRERMRLFRQVCEAVQHAHEHAIIHRDLKPSNILVRPDGTVRLLDFGIAKQLDAPGGGLNTTGSVPAPMTLRYAAPEQLTGALVGTHTDVYALGVTLYELLTGRTPLDLTGLTPGGVESAIVSQVPERPSRLIASGLARTDRHDLDVLCGTAIHKDPARRYRSVEALMRDLDHWLGHERLEARADSFFYRASKFAVRNRRALSIAAGLFLIAASGTVWFTWNLKRARDQAIREQVRTERVEQFVFSLFGSYDANAGPSKNVTVFSLLDQGRRQVRALAGEPELQADLYEVLGNLYGNLGRFDDANELLVAGLKEQQAEGSRSFKAAKGLLALGVLRAEQSRFREAEELARKGLDVLRQTKDVPKLEFASAEADAGLVIGSCQKFGDAVALLEDALQIQTRNGAKEGDVVQTLTYLAGARQGAGQYPEAADLLKRALAEARHAYGIAHLRVADVLEAFGNVRLLQQKFFEAQDDYTQALAIYRNWYGTEHPKTAEAIILLGQAMVDDKQYEAGRKTLSEGVDIGKRVLGERSAQLALALMALGTLEQNTGHLDAARSDLEQTIQRIRATFGSATPALGIATANLGGLEYKAKRYDRAEQLDREALTILGRLTTPEDPQLAKLRGNLGRVLLTEGKYREALPQLQTALALLSKQGNVSTENLNFLKAMLAKATKALE